MRFCEILIIGLYIEELHKYLIMHQPILITMHELKAALGTGQHCLLRYSMLILTLPVASMTGLVSAHEGKILVVAKGRQLQQLQSLQRQFVQQVNCSLFTFLPVFASRSKSLYTISTPSRHRRSTKFAT